MDRVKLILLVGIPGSGKTTYAQKYMTENGNCIHLSSDLIREELYGDASIQGEPHEVFSLMQSRAIAALNEGTSVVYDATNITRKDRSNIIAACPKFVKIEAHVVWAPIETCIERDASRERTVGQTVIDKMLKRFQPPYYDEGFDVIYLEWPNEFNPDVYAKNMWNKIKIPHDNPHHTLDINEHCLEASTIAEKFDNMEIEYAAMWHDIGKSYTKAFVDSKGNTCETAHYYSHQNYSAWISYGLPGTTPTIAWLIGAHMEPFGNTKYYNKLPNYLKTLVDQLHECDLNAH
jgi:predicted kinase